MRKLREQQVQQAAAAKAAAAAAPAEVYKPMTKVAATSNLIGTMSNRQESQGSEVFAMHNSPGGKICQESPNKHSVNSPPNKSNFGPSGGISITGQSIGMKREYSVTQMVTATAPAVKYNFKVVEYDDTHQSTGFGTKTDMDKYGTLASAGSGIHLGMSGPEFVPGKEGTNRINMDELHELLGN